MEMMFTKDEIAMLAKDFQKDVAAAPPNLKDLFCKAWPVAKQAIEVAMKIIKNPIALAALKIVESIGDALFSALGCGK